MNGLLQCVVENDLRLVKEASSFLVESVVPRFVHDCIQLVVLPMDGDALATAMHTRGINMRYLGHIAKLASLREDLQHIEVGVVYFWDGCGLTNLFVPVAASVFERDGPQAGQKETAQALAGQ